MKNFKNYLLIAFVGFGLAFTSCSKDDDSATDEFPVGEVHFIAKIDGEKFTATEIGAIEGDNETGPALMVMAENNQGQSFIIGISNFNGAGTYTIKDDEAGVIVFDENLEIGWWGEEGGEIVITHYKRGERIKGSFQFQLNNLNDDLREVTEGSFESQLVEE